MTETYRGDAPLAAEQGPPTEPLEPVPESLPRALERHFSLPLATAFAGGARPSTLLARANAPTNTDPMCYGALLPDQPSFLQRLAAQERQSGAPGPAALHLARQRLADCPDDFAPEGAWNAAALLVLSKTPTSSQLLAFRQRDLADQQALIEELIEASDGARYRKETR